MVDLTLKTFLTFLCFLLFNTTFQAQVQENSISLNSFDVRGDQEGVYLYNDKSNGNVSIFIDGSETVVEFINGKAKLDVVPDFKGELLFLQGGNASMKMVHVSKIGNGQLRIRNIPLWLSLVPPLVAIILALIFKEVVVSLFIGIWAGAFVIGGLRVESLYYFIMSFLEVIQKYIIGALNSSGHLSVIVFSLLIGGMVAIISKNGGMAGVVKSLSKYAKDAKSSQFITWLLGVAIFFDDYANTLIVGNTMRSVTDKFKISREKLAYIVDSTAAPVSAIAFITTWIGAELGYIDDGMSKIGLETDATAYSIFLSSLKYSFYPIFTLIFILILIKTQKDYGPMLKAEIRARTTGKVSSAVTESEDEPNMEDLSPVPGAPIKWQYAVFPVATVILMTIFGLLDTGFSSIYNELYPNGNGNTGYGSIWASMGTLFSETPSFFTKLGKVIGAADSYIALLWASLSGVIVALFMTIFGKVMKLFDAMHWMATGFKTMLPALIILTLAWALAITTEELHTADFLSNLLSGNISPYLLSVIIFILAAFIAFSTGSSWSTMAILYPIAIPTTYAVCTAAGMNPELTMEILLSVIATVLAASVLGDHCSPISDTTILSSLASDCNHIDHVKTQLPYALTVGSVSIVCVFLSTLLGGHGFVNLLLYIIGVGVMYFIVTKVGKTATADQ
ncbi:MAG: Na+/H+ antiporter NhaC family protein [Saprospiraceae bacterium]|nr:Na+/H+ antiporter NhaC family protein [Saprospiraceae bacterium]